LGLRKLKIGFRADYENRETDSIRITKKRFGILPGFQFPTGFGFQKKKINLWGITTFFGWGFEGIPGILVKKKPILVISAALLPFAY
jgi:hypothetical protein